jgi:hypothetical protein
MHYLDEERKNEYGTGGRRNTTTLHKRYLQKFMALFKLNKVSLYRDLY